MSSSSETQSEIIEITKQNNQFEKVSPSPSIEHELQDHDDTDELHHATTIEIDRIISPYRPDTELTEKTKTKKVKYKTNTKLERVVEMENENEEEDEENNNESSNDEITQQKDKKNNFKKSMNAKNSIVILSKNDMNEPIVQQNLRELVLKQQEYIKTGEGDIKRSSKTKKKIVSNMFQFSFSLIGCLIGSGILSLANACKQMGIVGFVAWIVATNVYYWYTWTYFNKAIYITGSSTIGEMFSLIFGNTFAIIVDICNTLFYCCILH